MRERGILFSPPMVGAIREDRKAQTRRAIRGVPSWDHYGRDIMDWGLSGIHQGDFDELAGSDRWYLDVQTDVDNNSRREIRCPYGAPGDRLVVREAHWLYGQWVENGQTEAGRQRWTLRQIGQQVRFDKPGHENVAYYGRGPGWAFRPGMHMPRWAAREVLEVVEVRVERLEDISESDALAEGIKHWGDGFHWEPNAGWPGESEGMKSARFVGLTAKQAYMGLWEEINGRESLDANPWVWAVSFRRLEQQARAA